MPSTRDQARRRRLPSRIDAALEVHRTRLLDHASGPVTPLAPAAGAVAPIPPAASPRSLLGVCALAASPQPATLLSGVRAQLEPGDRLLLLEPYRRIGWSGRLGVLARPLVQRLTGLRTDLPVADLLRRAGFTIATVERVTMPTAIIPLRSFCLVVAEPARSPAPPTPAPPAPPAVARSGAEVGA